MYKSIYIISKPGKIIFGLERKKRILLRRKYFLRRNSKEDSLRGVSNVLFLDPRVVIGAVFTFFFFNLDAQKYVNFSNVY